jgi:hypothetical protein
MTLEDVNIEIEKLLKTSRFRFDGSPELSDLLRF